MILKKKINPPPPKAFVTNGTSAKGPKTNLAPSVLKLITRVTQLPKVEKTTAPTDVFKIKTANPACKANPIPTVRKFIALRLFDIK